MAALLAAFLPPWCFANLNLLQTLFCGLELINIGRPLVAVSLYADVATAGHGGAAAAWLDAPASGSRHDIWVSNDTL